MLTEWLQLYTQSMTEAGYGGVIVLMALESSIVPIPSELVIPPAAYLAAVHHTFNLPLLVLAGTFGSWLGATVMYVICRYFGRGWLLRLGSWLGITESKLLSMDRWVAQTGSGAVFMARLLPVVRHLIGIPMGLARMSYWRYSVMTLLGSGLWCAVLAWVGVAAGHDPQLLAGDVQRLSLWFGVGALLLFGVYVWLVRRHFKA